MTKPCNSLALPIYTAIHQQNAGKLAINATDDQVDFSQTDMPLLNILYLSLGFRILTKTGLLNSISPVVMTFFKYFSAILTCHSSAWAFIYRSSFKRRYLFLSLLAVAMQFGKLSPFFCYANDASPLFFYAVDLFWTVRMNNSTERKAVILFWSGQIYLSNLGHHMNFSWNLVLFISIITTASRAMFTSTIKPLSASSLPLSSVAKLLLVDDTIKNLLPIALARITNISSLLREKKMTLKIIKYAIGLGGTVIFQNFFRLTTFSQVMGFFGLAIAWYANLCLIHIHDDFGVLNFLLGNMVVGSAVNQNELGILTWLTCGLCIYFYVLRLILKSTVSCDIPEPRGKYLCLVYPSLACFLPLYTLTLYVRV